MRVLQVIHQYPPHSSQGSEVYCRALAQHLSASCDVAVFHVSVLKNTWLRRLRQENQAEIQIFHCVDQGQYQRTANWENAYLQRCFLQTLKMFRPEIVHFHNYISLGDPLVSLAKQTGARIVYTLHDYGLICPNNLLLTSSGALCEKADSDFFGHCCPELLRVSAGRCSTLAGRLPSLSRWSRFAEQFPWGPGRWILKGAVRLAGRLLNQNSEQTIQQKRLFFQKATGGILRDVDLFLTPGRFLRDRFISCGVSPDRIRFVPNGIQHFARAARVPRTGKIRLGYLGALHAQKGIEVLLDAFEGLQEIAELHIHGSTFGSPISDCYWQRIQQGADPNVIMHGPYRNTELPDILASLDAVVVPSLWYENAPLTIQESLHAGVPVITSNCGGMAEMIHHEINGLTFEIGNSEALRAVFRRLHAEPDLLSRLAAGIQPVPSIEQQSKEVLHIYEELIHTSRG
jgi:glycosyltransferase involved in cell wall biosynthesis